MGKPPSVYKNRKMKAMFVKAPSVRDVLPLGKEGRSERAWRGKGSISKKHRLSVLVGRPVAR